MKDLDLSRCHIDESRSKIKCDSATRFIRRKFAESSTQDFKSKELYREYLSETTINVCGKQLFYHIFFLENLQWYWGKYIITSLLRPSAIITERNFIIEFIIHWLSLRLPAAVYKNVFKKENNAQKCVACQQVVHPNWSRRLPQPTFRQPVTELHRWGDDEAAAVTSQNDGRRNASVGSGQSYYDETRFLTQRNDETIRPQQRVGPNAAFGRRRYQPFGQHYGAGNKNRSSHHSPFSS